MKQKYILGLFVILLALPLVMAAGSYSGKLQVTSGGGRIIVSGPGANPSYACGNNFLEILNNEQCDGNDFSGLTCISFGYTSGALNCDANCQLDLRGCSSVNPGGSPSSSSSSGSSSTSTTSSASASSGCVESWQCTEWTPCVQGEQIRNCKDSSSCNTTKIMPEERRNCIPEVTNKTTGSSGFSGITGAVIGVLGIGGSILVIIFIVVIIILAIMAAVKKKK